MTRDEIDRLRLYEKGWFQRMAAFDVAQLRACDVQTLRELVVDRTAANGEGAE